MKVNGAQIRAARANAGKMTQAALARAIDTSERNIARWEHGDNEPRAEALMRIANATGHPVEFFYQGTPSADDSSASDLEAALMAALRAVVRDALNRERSNTA